MGEKHSDVNKYMETLTGAQQEWMRFFVDYMRRRHPELEEVISFQMPTYKLGSGKERNYIAFSPAKGHFSLHTMDFAYIAALKERLSAPGKGKGCVNAAYTAFEERSILLAAIEDIIGRKQNPT